MTELTSQILFILITNIIHKSLNSSSLNQEKTCEWWIDWVNSAEVILMYKLVTHPSLHSFWSHFYAAAFIWHGSTFFASHAIFHIHQCFITFDNSSQSLISGPSLPPPQSSRPDVLAKWLTDSYGCKRRRPRIRPVPQNFLYYIYVTNFFFENLYSSILNKITKIITIENLILSYWWYHTFIL